MLLAFQLEVLMMWLFIMIDSLPTDSEIEQGSVLDFVGGVQVGSEMTIPLQNSHPFVT